MDSENDVSELSRKENCAVVAAAHIAKGVQ